MQLELVRISDNQYRIISRSNKKHFALGIIGRFLLQYNKINTPKIGLFSIYLKPFSQEATVYSYLSGKTVKMNRIKYQKWMNGTTKGLVSKKDQKINSWLSKGAIKKEKAKI